MKTEASGRSYNQTSRAVAAEATGQRIVDAFLTGLMQHWYDEITLERVAEEAGVTVQTVVRRFGSKDKLLAEAVQTLNLQIGRRRASSPGDMDRLVENLVEDYEHTGDAVIRLLALEPRHPALGEVLDFGRGQHRNWVAAAFAEPLSSLPEASRQAALDGLVVVTDVYAWKLLRRDMLRSRSETTGTLKTLVRKTIDWGG